MSSKKKNLYNLRNHCFQTIKNNGQLFPETTYTWNKAKQDTKMVSVVIICAVCRNTLK